jgi:hypothetical protein
MSSPFYDNKNIQNKMFIDIIPNKNEKYNNME